MSTIRFFATAAKGTASIVARELAGIHAEQIEPTEGGVHFRGSMETLYRANLWLRAASRVLMPLAEFPCATPQALYEGVRRTPWSRWMTLRHTFSVDCNCRDSQISHSHYAALKIKDAIVDQFRDKTGRRPNVRPRYPDIRIHAYIKKDRCVLSLDASGEGLHMRGYRRQTVEAPLRETLAAVIVELVDWDGEGLFIDPMCGSGTILVEAAMKAMNYAPGLLRCEDAAGGTTGFCFERWRGFDRRAWARLIEETRDQVREKIPGRLLGYDISRDSVAAARQNVQLAGFDKQIRLERGNILNLSPRANRGVIVANLPYGVRTGESEALRLLYRQIGDVLKQQCTGYTAYLFTGNLKLAKLIGLRTAKRFILHNGPIECRLLKYELF